MTSYLITLLGSSVVLTLVILALLLSKKALRKRFTSGCRYAIWLIVILRLCIPFTFIGLPAFISVPIPELSQSDEHDLSPSVTEHTDIKNSISPSDERPVQYVPVDTQGTEGLPINSDTSADEEYAAQTGVTSVGIETSVVGSIEKYDPAQPAETVSGNVTSDKGEKPGKLNISIPYAVFAVWLTGAIGFLAYDIVVYLRYIKKIENNTRFADKEITAVYDRVCKVKGVKKAPDLYVSSEVTSPMLMGYRRSMIVIPELDLNERAIEGIISHELTHYKRLDLWAKLAAVVARSVHWFNPLVRLAVRMLNEEMELSCDERALKGVSDDARIEYGSVMVEILKHCKDRTNPLSTHFNPDAESAKGRINNIFDKTKKNKGILLVAVCLLLCAVAGSVFGCVNKSSEQKDDGGNGGKTPLQGAMEYSFAMDCMEVFADKDTLSYLNSLGGSEYSVNAKGMTVLRLDTEDEWDAFIGGFGSDAEKLSGITELFDKKHFEDGCVLLVYAKNPLNKWYSLDSLKRGKNSLEIGFRVFEDKDAAKETDHQFYAFGFKRTDLESITEYSVSEIKINEPTYSVIESKELTDDSPFAERTYHPTYCYEGFDKSQYRSLEGLRLTLDLPQSWQGYMGDESSKYYYEKDGEDRLMLDMSMLSRVDQSYSLYTHTVIEGYESNYLGRDYAIDLHNVNELNIKTGKTANGYDYICYDGLIAYVKVANNYVLRLLFYKECGKEKAERIIDSIKMTAVEEAVSDGALGMDGDDIDKMDIASGEKNVVKAFLNKDVKTLEKLCGYDEGTLKAYESLEFGEFWLMKYRQNGVRRLELTVEVKRSEGTEIPVGTVSFDVEYYNGAYYITYNRFEYEEPLLVYLYNSYGNVYFDRGVVTRVDPSIYLPKELVVNWLSVSGAGYGIVPEIDLPANERKNYSRIVFQVLGKYHQRIVEANDQRYGHIMSLEASEWVSSRATAIFGLTDRSGFNKAFEKDAAGNYILSHSHGGDTYSYRLIDPARGDTCVMQFYADYGQTVKSHLINYRYSYSSDLVDEIVFEIAESAEYEPYVLECGVKTVKTAKAEAVAPDGDKQISQTVEDIEQLNIDSNRRRLIKAFLTKDIAAVEELSGYTAGTLASYKDLELGGFTVKDDNGNVTLEVEIKKCGSTAIKEGIAVFEVVNEPFGCFLVYQSGGDNIRLSEVENGGVFLETWLTSRWLRYDLKRATDSFVPSDFNYATGLYDFLYRYLAKELNDNGEYVDMDYVIRSCLTTAPQLFQLMGVEDNAKLDYVFRQREADKGYYYNLKNGITEYIYDVTEVDGNSITLRFYADYGKTVSSHLVKYKIKDGDPLPTELGYQIIERGDIAPYKVQRFLYE